jgi:hypothetical protein
MLSFVLRTPRVSVLRAAAKAHVRLSMLAGRRMVYPLVDAFIL